VAENTRANVARKGWPLTLLRRLFSPDRAGGAVDLESTEKGIDGGQVLHLAEAGDLEAQYMLGRQLALGQGETRKDKETAYWLRRAALQGHAEAQFQLGNLCHTLSLGDFDRTSENRVEAYVWFHIAGEQGHFRAQVSCEMLNLKMTEAEILAGNCRVNEFQVSKEPGRGV
jgi:hypothetical protein